MKTVLITLFVTCCLSGTLHSELILNVNLQNPSQTSTQITVDVVGSFQSTDPGGNLVLGHRIESINLDLNNSSVTLQNLPPQNLFNRFSVLSGYWDAVIETSLGSILLSPLPSNPTDYLLSGDTRTLATITIDTAGLSTGSYSLSIYDSNPAFVDALGDFGGGPELLVDQAGGILNAPAVSFSITAVPEPGSLLLSSLASLFCFARFRLERRQ